MAGYSKQAKKTINKASKQAVVVELTEKVAKATAVVATNYQGMTHLQLEALKKTLRAADAELVVTKNTLLKRALEGKSELPTEGFDLPTATLFTYGDPILALKEIAKSIKALQLPKIKFGVFEGKVLAEADVVRLSTLPTKDVLLAQLVGGLKSPIFGLHRALSWNLQKFVMTLKAIEAKKA